MTAAGLATIFGMIHETTRATILATTAAILVLIVAAAPRTVTIDTTADMTMIHHGKHYHHLSRPRRRRLHLRLHRNLLRRLRCPCQCLQRRDLKVSDLTL